MTLPAVELGLTINPNIVMELMDLHCVDGPQGAINWLVDYWKDMKDKVLTYTRRDHTYSGVGADRFPDQDISLLMDKPGIVQYFEIGGESDDGRCMIELADGTKVIRRMRRVPGKPGGWEMGQLYSMEHVTTDMAKPGSERTLKVLQRDDRVFEIDLRNIPERPKYPDLTGMKVAAKMAAEEKYYQDMQNWELRYNPGP